MRRSKDREEMEQGINEIGGCQNLLYLCGMDLGIDEIGRLSKLIILM